MRLRGREGMKHIRSPYRRQPVLRPGAQPTVTTDDETICTLGAVLADGSWLWRMEAQRASGGFRLVYRDEETGGRWTVSRCPERYSWQRFAQMLCEWRRHAGEIPPDVDLSWIPDEESKLVTVSGETGVVARILRLCLTLGESRLGLWLAGQSDTSLAALEAALPNFLVEPRRLILEEMAEWVAALGRPVDLLGLCGHYGLGPPEPGLVEVRKRLAADMEQLVLSVAARKGPDDVSPREA